MSSGTAECCRSQHRNATLLCRSIPEIISSAPAGWCLIYWATPNGEWSFSGWIWVRSWVSVNLPLHFERAGNQAEARESARKVPSDSPYRALIVACLDQTPAAELEQEVRAYTPVSLADPDPENRYWDGSSYGFLRQKDIAIRLLKSAIEGHYCAYTALQKDPLLATLRDTPEFGSCSPRQKNARTIFSPRELNSRTEWFSAFLHAEMGNRPTLQIPLFCRW